MDSGVVPAKETLKDRIEFTKALKEFNLENKSNPACETCALFAFERGNFKSADEFQKMTKTRESRVILDKRGGNVIWGKMVDWKCEHGHGISFEYYPGEFDDDKNKIQK